ncbi:MAG TPA: hypothetical protein VG733_04020 [Chthoniobacteraceae bacterium]|nr:hypothetical protein [Chthoniobacteraceae bacterium]
MNPPAHADAPASAQRAAGAAWGKVVLAAVVLVLAVLLVLPGFMAAWFSRGHAVVLLNNVAWMGKWGMGNEPMALRVEMGILTPSDYLMMHSKPIRHFYRWEFRLAGGEEMQAPPLTLQFKLPQD